MDLEQIENAARTAGDDDVLELVGLARKQEQALIDSNASLMEQTELADRCRKQAETLEAELKRARLDNSELRNANHFQRQQIAELTAPKNTVAASVPVQAGMPEVTVDTPAFRAALSDVMACECRAQETYDNLLIAHIDAHTQASVAQTIAKYEADILALYDRQREDGNTIAALRAAAPQQHAQAAQYADNGKQHEDPTGPNHPGQHDGHTCEAMGQMLADFGSQRTTPESVVARMDTQAALSDQVWADSPEFVTAKDALVDAGVKSAQSGASIDVQAYLAAEDHFIETVSALATPAIQQEGAALSDEQIGEAVQRGYSKDDGIRMCYSDQQNVIKEVRTILAASQQPAAAPSVPDDALSISGWLRHFAGNGGYSHNDYADTMRQAADELDRAAAPAIQQEGAALDLRHGDEIIRYSDQSVRIRFKSARAASEFERQSRAALAAPVPVQPAHGEALSQQAEDSRLLDWLEANCATLTRLHDNSGYILSVNGLAISTGKTSRAALLAINKQEPTA